MLNKVMIIGRLGRDPELRYTQAGVPVCSLNVATSESYLDRDGKRVDRTEWHRVSVFQRAAENCANYLRKGSLVYVEGSLTTRKWQDAQGQDRYSTEIKGQRVQFMDRKDDARPPMGDGGSDQGFGGAGYDGGYQGGPQNDYDNQFSGQQGGQYGAQQGGQQGGQQGRAQRQNAPQQQNDTLGPAFPSEASGMDDMPF